MHSYSWQLYVYTTVFWGLLLASKFLDNSLLLSINKVENFVYFVFDMSYSFISLYDLLLVNIMTCFSYYIGL